MLNEKEVTLIANISSAVSLTKLIDHFNIHAIYLEFHLVQCKSV